ncbi:acylneuraminate cytidylyltransferase family protein [Alphaproteobacteria bacterium]|nr:acylneuraminate cytidylyltransferase family protein [Alphaproteobacteria bacterium]
MNKSKLICIINARSGSKRIKNKNIITFYDKPLIYWTINAAKKSKIFNEIYVNTDSELISKISKKYGAKVPFIRPKELAQDMTTSVDSTVFFIENLNISFDYFSLLQPTSPLRTKNDIINFHNFVEKNKFKSAVTLSLLQNNSSNAYGISRGYSLKLLDNKEINIYKKKYYFNGSIYYNNVYSFLRYQRFIFTYTKGYIMNRTNSIDIDTLDDLKIAKKYFKHYIK